MGNILPFNPTQYPQSLNARESCICFWTSHLVLFLLGLLHGRHKIWYNDTNMGYRLYIALCTVLLFGIFFGFSGCSRNSDDNATPGIHVAEGRGKFISDMKPGDVIVVVNGEKLTKRDFDALLRVRTAIFQLQSKIDIEDLDGDPVKEFVWNNQFSIVPELIHHKLFAQYAAERGIVPSDDAVAASRTRFAGNVRRRVDELVRLADRLGGEAGRLFLQIPYVDAQDALLRQSVATNDLNTISDEEVSAAQARIAAWDKNAERNNEESKKRLSAARAEIDAGGDFAAVAAKYAQVSPEHGKEWATFELGELPQEEDLYKWLVTAKAGDISPPLDLDDGIAIVKLVEVGKGEAPQGAVRPDTYRLVKCTAYAYQYIQHLERPELEGELVKAKMRDAQRALGTMLMGRAVLEYPNGTNFFNMAMFTEGE